MNRHYSQSRRGRTSNPSALIMGGIYGMPSAFRTLNLQQTTETVLERNLPAFGWNIVTSGHHDRPRLDGIDIIHIHHLGRGCVTIPLRNIRHNVPIIFTRHATKSLPLMHQLALQGIEHQSAAIVALTGSEYDILLRRQPRRTRLIHNGVDTNLFRPVARAVFRQERPFEFLYVGQLIELKRVHLAILAMNHLRLTGRRVHLRIISHRPTLRGELEALVHSLEMTEQVSFLPPAGRAEIAAAMQSADAFILPSRTEASPTVIVEAGLTGLPVVSFNVGGVSELVPPCTSLPAVDDFESFISAAAAVYDDHELYVRTVSDFHDQLAKQHSIAKMVGAHDRLYREILQGGID